MSVTLPLIYSNDDLIHSLGRPYQMVADSEGDRGFINPVMRVPNGKSVHYVDMRQPKNNPNNHTTEAYLHMPFDTNPEAPTASQVQGYDYLQSAVDSFGKPSYYDISVEPFVDVGIDPRLLTAMKREGETSPDDIFDEFGQKTTNFVNLIKRGNQAAERERTLYMTPVERKAEVFQDMLKSDAMIAKTLQEEEKASVMSKKKKEDKSTDSTNSRPVSVEEAVAAIPEENKINMSPANLTSLFKTEL